MPVGPGAAHVRKRSASHSAGARAASSGAGGADSASTSGGTWLVAAAVGSGRRGLAGTAACGTSRDGWGGAWPGSLRELSLVRGMGRLPALGIRPCCCTPPERSARAASAKRSTRASAGTSRSRRRTWLLWLRNSTPSIMSTRMLASAQGRCVCCECRGLCLLTGARGTARLVPRLLPAGGGEVMVKAAKMVYDTRPTLRRTLLPAGGWVSLPLQAGGAQVSVFGDEFVRE